MTVEWLTAEAIDDVKFTERWVRRGYDEDQVDALLDRVASDFEEMQAYIRELEARLVTHNHPTEGIDMLMVGCPACLPAEVTEAFDAGRVAGRQELHAEIWEAAEPAEFDRRRAESLRLMHAPGTLSFYPYPGEHAWQEQMAAELAPEALEGSAALQLDEGSQRDVPEPGREVTAAGDGPSGRPAEDRAGLGHPSPYAGTPTPAQRRRDKHKQRGQYAPGDLPDPPTDVGAWWQEELAALLRDGQSGWLTRNLAGVT